MSEELENTIPKKFHFDELPIVKVDGRSSRRPTLFTDGRKKKILLAFKAGATEKYAAGYAGIDLTTLRRWIAKGSEGDEESTGVAKDLYLFQQACLEARSMNALQILKVVYDGIKGNPGDKDKGIKPTSPDPKLALEALKVLHPEEYGQNNSKVKHEINGQITHVHKKGINVDKLSLEELNQLESVYLKQLEAGNISEDIIDAEVIE